MCFFTFECRTTYIIYEWLYGSKNLIKIYNDVIVIIWINFFMLTFYFNLQKKKKKLTNQSKYIDVVSAANNHIEYLNWPLNYLLHMKCTLANLIVLFYKPSFPTQKRWHHYFNIRSYNVGATLQSEIRCAIFYFTANLTVG